MAGSSLEHTLLTLLYTMGAIEVTNWRDQLLWNVYSTKRGVGKLPPVEVRVITLKDEKKKHLPNLRKLLRISPMLIRSVIHGLICYHWICVLICKVNYEWNFYQLPIAFFTLEWLNVALCNQTKAIGDGTSSFLGGIHLSCISYVGNTANSENILCLLQGGLIFKNTPQEKMELL